MARITIKRTSPPSGTGTVGYRGQDEFSRKFIGNYTVDAITPRDYICEQQLGTFAHHVGASGHTLEILPHVTKPYKVPEQEAF